MRRRVLLRSWMAGSPNPGRRDLVAWGIAARHDEPSRALLSQLLVGRGVQRSLRDRQLRRRTRCRAMECACGRHVIPDARLVLELPMTLAAEASMKRAGALTAG